ncbi:MAG TPA: cytochrome c [Terriglobales bacterium]|jgi:mono/diheme cytochrome c family protein
MKPLLTIAVILLSASGPMLAQGGNPKPAAQAQRIARGKYIVEGLSRCQQCHTPHNEQGNPDNRHPLDGAPVWLQPVTPPADWPLKAPRIAGTLSASDAELVRLLTTGIWKDGKPLRQPMPQFRMTQEDAEAVVAYLRSLRPERP